jgi:O-antigen ligase
VSRAGSLRAALAILLIYLVFTAWLPERIYYSVFQVGTLVVTCLWILHVTLRERPVWFPWPIRTMLLIASWGGVQLATHRSVYAWKTAVATLDWLVFAAIGWLACQAFAGWEPQMLFRKCIAVLGIVVSVLSVCHWYLSPGMILWSVPNPYAFRVCFPLLNHSHFAALEELSLGPAVWLAMQNAGSSQFYTFSSALMAASVFATGSRSGSAIITIELFLLILLNLRLASSAVGRFWKRRQALVLGLFALLVVAGAGWQELAARFAVSQRDELRPLFAASTLDMVKARPLAGFGLGTWETVYPAYARVDPGMFVEHAHNDWLEWAAEGGLPFAGFMLMLAVFGLRRAATQPWCFGIVAVFTQSLFEFSLHKPALIALQFAAIGCLSACAASPIADVSSTKQN